MKKPPRACRKQDQVVGQILAKLRGLWPPSLWSEIHRLRDELKLEGEKKRDWRPEDVQPAIDILRTRCAELSGDQSAALDQEWHNRIAGDDALARAYKLAIAHLLFSSGQLVSITETPFQCPRCLWFGGFGECEGDGDDSGQCPRCGTPCIDRASNTTPDRQEGAR